MQEHPIPQDITGYKFHIIGSMTLKQFGEIFLGVILAVIFYKTNLIGVIKWPLVILSFGMGVAAAFLPIEERPLDHWIITFFKVLYKPTKFYWRREPKIPEPFTYKPEIEKIEDNTLDLTPAKRQRIREYVGSIPEVSATPQDFTNDELSRMQNILTSFTDVQVKTQTITTTETKQEKPRIDVRVRKMRKPVAQEVVIFGNDTVIPLHTEGIYETPQRKTLNSQTFDQKKSILATDQVATDIEIPEEQAIKAVSQEEVEEKLTSTQESVNDMSEKSFIEAESTNKEETIATTEASYNTNLPFPIKPTEPNKVVGMVLSQNNDLLTNAIVEVQTTQGSIARAVKTNALGQFFITTPLKNGDYNVVIEKSGYQFQPQHLKIDDSIIPPMEIRSVN